MPRYFFHISNGFGHTTDAEGAELPSIAEAEQHAIEGARSLLSEEVTSGKLDLRGRIEITDESGDQVLVVQYADTVEVQRGELPETPGGEESAS